MFRWTMRRRHGGGATDLVALDDAIKALARLDPRKARVVEMRFFGGLSVEETAAVLKVSPVTVMRDWRSAKAWLYRELTDGTARDPERWKQVDSLLQAVLELPPEQRESFLRRACGGRSALEREHGAPGRAATRRQLSRPSRPRARGEALAREQRSRPRRADELIGGVVSHYRVVGKLGAAGWAWSTRRRTPGSIGGVALKFVSSRAG